MSEDTAKRVKDAVDIVAVVRERVSLTKAGNEYRGLCPFHDEKTPSFSVNPAKQAFYCFGCSEGGDVLTFVQKTDKLSFPDALQKLAARAGITLPQYQASPQRQEQRKTAEHLSAVLERAARHFKRSLDGNEQALHYLQTQRGFSQTTIDTFQLGLDDGNVAALRKSCDASAEDMVKAGLLFVRDDGTTTSRFRRRITIPIRSAKGEMVGFGARVWESQEGAKSKYMVKYINSPETPLFKKKEILFGLHQVSEEADSLYVVEGYFDVLALTQRGFKAAVGLLGSACSEHHLRILQARAQRQRVVFLLDGDAAGRKSALSVSHAAFNVADEGSNMTIASLPRDADPDGFLAKNGKSALEELANDKNARPFHVYRFQEEIYRLCEGAHWPKEQVAAFKKDCREAARRTQGRFDMTPFYEKLLDGLWRERMRRFYAERKKGKKVLHEFPEDALSAEQIFIDLVKSLKYKLEKASEDVFAEAEERISHFPAWFQSLYDSTVLTAEDRQAQNFLARDLDVSSALAFIAHNIDSREKNSDSTLANNPSSKEKTTLM